MPHAIWSGSLGFGLVSIPVRLYSATEQKDVRFHQVEKGTGRRVRMRRVAEGTEDEVPYERIVKGYELDNGKLVTFTPAELKAIDVGPTGSIDVQAFVGLAEIDPIFYQHTYFIAPGKGGDRPYALLHEVMDDAERVAVCTFVMSGKQHLALVRPYDGRLALEVLYYPDEIRTDDGLAKPTARSAPEREKAVARQLVDALTTPWTPSDFKDTYREAVLSMIRAKARGDALDAAPEPPKATKVTDLMAALEASLAERAKANTSSPAKRATKPAPKASTGTKSSKPSSKASTTSSASSTKRAGGTRRGRAA